MSQLFADEDFSYPVVEALRQLGHDIVTVQEVGIRGRSDYFVLAFSTNVGRAVVTSNRRDFIRLHRQTSHHGGIIVCTDDPDASALARRIDSVIAQAGALANQLLRINRPSIP